MDQNNSSTPSSPPENTDLAKQYQDILDRYSEELASQPATPPVTLPKEPDLVPPLPESTPVVEPKPPILPDFPEDKDIPLTIIPPPDPPLPVPPSAPTEILPPPPIVPLVKSPMSEEADLVSSSPKSGGFFKILFFISLLVFLGVFGAIVYTVYFANNSGKLQKLPAVSSQATPTPSSTGVCDLNDKQYAVGESFASADGCNTCSCTPDLTIVCTEKACDITPTSTATTSAIPTQTLRSQVENWSSYTQSPTKLSWDKCEGEPTVSSSLKDLISTSLVSIKEINGLKLIYTSKFNFTAQDITKFTLCEAGNYYPIYTFNDKILGISACSTGMSPDNPKCEDTRTQIEKLYGYQK